MADLLQRLVEGVQLALEATAVGVLLEREGRRLAVTAASREDMRTLELFELQGETGPCYAAYARSEQVVVEDVEDFRERWPGFADQALELGFRSVHAFPLRLRGEAIGALNVVNESVTALSDKDIQLVQSLADIATIGIIQERTVSDARTLSGQLQHALDSRVLIEQAKGMLAERLGLSPGAAFERLRDHSRNHNVRLRELCRRVIDEGFVPD